MVFEDLAVRFRNGSPAASPNRHPFRRRFNLAWDVTTSDKLAESVRAHLAICELLESTTLSSQTKRQLLNLRRLLELEISALQSEQCATHATPGETNEP